MAYPFVASYFDYGPRDASIKPLIINVHMAEGGGTVGFLAKKNPNGVSVHYVIEYGGRIVQMLHESHVNGSINPRDIRTTDDAPYTYRGATIRYGATAAKKALGQWWSDPNRATIGIEIEGFAAAGPNLAQQRALAELVRDIRTRQPGAPLLGHRDFADYKACPGKRIDWGALGGHGIPDATGGDMALDVPESLTSDWRIALAVGTPFFDDAACTDKRGSVSVKQEAVYVGKAGIARAVKLLTGGDHMAVYVKSADVPDPVRLLQPVGPSYTVIVGGKEVGSVTLP